MAGLLRHIVIHWLSNTHTAVKQQAGTMARAEAGHHATHSILPINNSLWSYFPRGSIGTPEKSPLYDKQV